MTSTVVGSIPTKYLIITKIINYIYHKNSFIKINSFRKVHLHIYNSIYTYYSDSIHNDVTYTIYNNIVKFKNNFRYTMSLLYIDSILITLSTYNNITKIKKKLKKKFRFLTNLLFMYKLINIIKYFDKSNIEVFFFYKNINFFNIFIFNDMIKLQNFAKILNTTMLFNINFSYKPNKYTKKIKTIKKFRKKIFTKVTFKKYKTIYS